MAEIFGALAALFYAASSIAVRRGVEDMSVMAGLFVSLAVGAMATAILYFGSGAGTGSVADLVGFLIAGILGPCIGRGTSMMGVSLLGPSRSVPLQTSLYPIFATISAVIFLKERIVLLQALGLAVVAYGVWQISRSDPRVADDQECSTFSFFSFRWPAILLPLLAGIAFGAADVFRKAAIGATHDPLLGAVIGTCTAFFVWGIVFGLSGPARRDLKFGRGAGWFAIAGLLVAAAILSLITALERGDVSVVSPILASQPLGVLLLSSLLLKRLERLTVRIVVGAISVVAGTVMISVLR